MQRLAAAAGPSRRDLLRLACGMVVAASAGAQPRSELRILLAAQTAQREAVVRALRARWAAASEFSDISAAARGRPAPLAYVAVGAPALQQALANALDAPLIALLVSRQTYGRLVEQSARPPRGVTALFAESSPAQQMRTIAAVMRRPVTVGALASSQSSYTEASIKAAADATGLSATVKAYDPAIGLSRNLLRLAAADAILIYPDSEIYTPDSLRELLESTYRRRQPVFGFSEALVKAGTLASAFSSADDLAAQVVELLGPVTEGRLPAPQYPRYWHVAINESVARSLDIVVDAAARNLGDRP